jgi:hypothetical protein
MLPMDGDVLLCPECRDPANGLHHRRVTVHERAEDDSQVSLTIVETSRGGYARNRAELPPVPLNPSERRGGVVVEFECEMCERIYTLTLAQHKGATLITFS